MFERRLIKKQVDKLDKAHQQMRKEAQKCGELFRLFLDKNVKGKHCYIEELRNNDGLLLTKKLTICNIDLAGFMVRHTDWRGLNWSFTDNKTIITYICTVRDHQAFKSLAV